MTKARQIKTTAMERDPSSSDRRAEPNWLAAAEYALRDADLCAKHGNTSGEAAYRLEADDYLKMLTSIPSERRNDE